MPSESDDEDRKAEDLCVRLLDNAPGIYGCKVHVAAHDIGLPAPNRVELLLRGALAREIGRSAMPQVMKGEVLDGRGLACGLKRRTVSVEPSGGAHENTIIVQATYLTVFLQ